MGHAQGVFISKERSMEEGRDMDPKELISFTDTELMTALLSGKSLKVFWKDKERRFIGAS